MDAVEKIEGEEIEVEKVEVEKNVKKPRKPMSEETLEKLAKAREKANAKRKEMSEERKVHKETLVRRKWKKKNGGSRLNRTQSSPQMVRRSGQVKKGMYSCLCSTHRFPD